MGSDRARHYSCNGMVSPSHGVFTSKALSPIYTYYIQPSDTVLCNLGFQPASPCKTLKFNTKTLASPSLQNKKNNNNILLDKSSVIVSFAMGVFLFYFKFLITYRSVYLLYGLVLFSLGKGRRERG